MPKKRLRVTASFPLWWVMHVVFVSCAQYQLEKKDNPFARFGINAVSVPMFVNRAHYPELGPIFTQKMLEMLGDFRQLQVYSGEETRSQGVLLGIITPRADKLTENSVITSTLFTASGLQDSIGERKDFYLPSTVRHDLNLTLVLIKGGQEMFRYTIGVQTTQNLVLMKGLGVDDGGVVNFTHNLANQQMLFAQSATEAMGKFKDLVLYAF